MIYKNPAALVEIPASKEFNTEKQEKREALQLEVKEPMSEEDIIQPIDDEVLNNLILINNTDKLGPLGIREDLAPEDVEEGVVNENTNYKGGSTFLEVWNT